jgi:hypothetical protein
MTCEWIIIRKETVKSYLKVLSQDSSGGTEKNNENFTRV